MTSVQNRMEVSDRSCCQLASTCSKCRFGCAAPWGFQTSRPHLAKGFGAPSAGVANHYDLPSLLAQFGHDGLPQLKSLSFRAA